MNFSEFVRGRLGSPYPAGAGDVVTQRFTINMTAAFLALNQLTEIARIPPDCVITDFVMVSDRFDTNATPTMTMNVGLFGGTYGVNDDLRATGSEFFLNSTLCQTGGIARPTQVGAFRIPQADFDRGIGVKINTAAATLAAGQLDFLVSYVAAA
jgi:hypothetical protein